MRIAWFYLIAIAMLIFGGTAGYTLEARKAGIEIQTLQTELASIKKLETERDATNVKQRAAIRSALAAMQDCGVQ